MRMQANSVYRDNLGTGMSFGANFKFSCACVSMPTNTREAQNKLKSILYLFLINIFFLFIFYLTSTNNLYQNSPPSGKEESP